MKKLTSADQGIKLVSKPSDFDEYDDDPGVLRAELSCGHVIDPESLTSCCKVQLEMGRTELKCDLCEREWPYDEVRRLAKLSLEEKESFEDSLATNTLKAVDHRDCPGCGFSIEREQTSNLCVNCLYCTARTGKLYEFCWQCEREWKGPRPRADQCGNVGCNSGDKDLLKECPEITLKSVQNVSCPGIRACPFCGARIEHTKEGCKIMSCQECKNKFCFVCLKPSKDCLKTARHFVVCTAGVAPRQIQ